jgi:hypothetical protein
MLTKCVAVGATGSLPARAGGRDCRGFARADKLPVAPLNHYGVCLLTAYFVYGSFD